MNIEAQPLLADRSVGTVAVVFAANDPSSRPMPAVAPSRAPSTSGTTPSDGIDREPAVPSDCLHPRFGWSVRPSRSMRAPTPASKAPGGPAAVTWRRAVKERRPPRRQRRRSRRAAPNLGASAVAASNPDFQNAASQIRVEAARQRTTSACQPRSGPEVVKSARLDETRRRTRAPRSSTRRDGDGRHKQRKASERFTARRSSKMTSRHSPGRTLPTARTTPRSWRRAMP